MHSKDIFTAMLASYDHGEIQSQLKFNLAIAKDKLVSTYGLDQLNQVFSLG